LAPGEREYLRTHWHLIADLRAALRTQREVRLAVIYGSVARGDEDDDSDFDLLVSLAPGRSPGESEVADRVAEIVNRRVDLAELRRVESGAPLLLDRVLDEGRVLVDRDGHWAELQQRRVAIRARARRAYRRQLAGSSLAIDELTR
jgi:predicted nucleotidyltransferase